MDGGQNKRSSVEDAASTPRTLIRSCRFRLLPNKAQHQALDSILESQRLLYNAALQERIEAWRKARLSISAFDQMKSLTIIRRDDPEGYGALPSNLSRATLRRLDETFKGFFRRVTQSRRLGGEAGRKPGFPRFKPMSRWDSFGFAEFSGITFDGQRLRFKSMPGGLRVHRHRDLPPGAKLLACQLRRDAKGWSVSLQVKYPIRVSPHTGPAVGLDVGIEKLAALSDGTLLPNARTLDRHAARLRRAQRALQRSRKGSVTRARRRRQLARLHQKTANTRETHLHQQSAWLTRTYAVIVVEKLSIQSLSASAKGNTEVPGTNVRQKAGLNRNILDAAWGRFQNQIRYKAECAGGRILEVNPHHTSQICSGCGVRVQKALSERVHRCPACGLEMDRDVNAARNILQRGLEINDSDAHPSGWGVVAPGQLTVGVARPCVLAETSLGISK